MKAPFVTVVEHKYARGWPKFPIGKPEDKAWVVPLSEALEREFQTDAYLTQYASPLPRRLGAEAIDAGVFPTLNIIVFDVDYQPAHETGEEVPDSWRVELGERVLALDEAHPGVYYYETRGGGRFLYKLPEPMIIGSREDARRWQQTYAVCVAYLHRFGIAADPSCKDWQRLFRLPRVVRDGVRQTFEGFGDPSNIGALSIEPTAEDVDKARRLVPRAFLRTTQIDRTPSGQRGIFFHLLDAREWVLREHHEPGVYVVRCPNDAEHSKGTPGDGSTVLYPPTLGKDLGAIFCRHGHCEPVMTARKWLAFFSEDELQVAQTQHAAEAEAGEVTETGPQK